MCLTKPAAFLEAVQILVAWTLAVMGSLGLTMC